MVTKWKNVSPYVRGVAGFFLTISLLVSCGLPLLASGLAFGDSWSLPEVLKSDFQDTAVFRNHVSNYMNTCLSIATGGPVDLTEVPSYRGEVPQSTIAWPSEEDARTYWKEGAVQWNEAMQKNQNIIYRVVSGGQLLYKNTTHSLTSLPEGYNFRMVFSGETCQAYQGSREIDLYGDGIYRSGGKQWSIPGYSNYIADPGLSNVRVFLAVREEPTLYQTSYQTSNYALLNKDAFWDFNRLYWLKSDWRQYREAAMRQIAGIVFGLIFLVASRPGWEEKRRIDQKIATITNHWYFEAKVLLFVLTVLVWLGIFRAEINAFRIETGNLRTWDGYRLLFWVSYLGERLRSHPWKLLLAFWTGYLFVNDLRYGDKIWKHGFFARRRQKELQFPIPKRLKRRARRYLFLQMVLFVLIVFVSLFLWHYMELEWLILESILGIALLVVGATAMFGLCPKRLWEELHLLTNQIAAVRNGNLDPVSALPEDSDFYAASQDLTEIQQGLKKALDEQIRSERMKVELVTNVSHDIKTPLTSIISYTELLRQEDLPQPAKDYVQILSQKAERLRSMVLDVFEVSKAASDNLPVSMERLDLNKLLRQTLADMSESIEAAPVTLRQNLPEEPVLIEADGQRLYRVFQNLIQNALQYSLENTRIYLSLTVRDGQAEACLKNTSKTELPTGVDFTERFFRGDASRTDGGSGLGLAIAESFTRSCGGSLRIEPIADLFVATVTFSVVDTP